MANIVSHLISADGPGFSGLVPPAAISFQVSPDGRSILFSVSPFENEKEAEESNRRSETEQRIADLEADLEFTADARRKLEDQNDLLRADLDQAGYKAEAATGYLARLVRAIDGTAPSGTLRDLSEARQEYVAALMAARSFAL